MKSTLFPSFFSLSDLAAQHHPHIIDISVNLHPFDIPLQSTPLTNSRYKKYNGTTPFIHLSLVLCQFLNVALSSILKCRTLVIPAQAGIQEIMLQNWIPVYTGMTVD